VRDRSFQGHSFAIIAQGSHIDRLGELIYTANWTNAGDGSPAQQGGI
jgi:hypothetical protein